MCEDVLQNMPRNTTKQKKIEIQLWCPVCEDVCSLGIINNQSAVR